MSLTDAEIDAIADRVAAKLRAPAPAVDPHQVVSAADAMVMLGVRSASAFSRRIRKLGVRSVGRGAYRRGDIQTAVLRWTATQRPAPKKR